MFVGCGYNFLADKNALDPSPILADTFTSTTLKNGVFDRFCVQRELITQSPTDEWTYLTIMDANFNGNLTAGNVNYAIDQISGFKIKRRKVQDFDWITLAFIPISKESPQILYNDNFAVDGEEYEYAIVPVVGDTECNYVTDTIGAKFNGVFLCDADTIYKFYAGVEYGAGTRVQKIGVFEPYGRQYPVVVSNGYTNYMSGSFSGTVLPPGYLQSKELNRLETVKEQDALLDFLTNKRAKILKDWNGRAILLVVSDSPVLNFLGGSGMGLANVGASYVEIGDVNNQQDLYNAGLVSEVE